MRKDRADRHSPDAEGPSSVCADETRFDAWYRTHFKRLQAISLRITHDQAAAEDIAQDALLRAWLSRDIIREAEVGAWLSVVVRNLSVSHLRKNNRSIPSNAVPEKPDSSADPAAIADLRETQRIVRRAFSQLGDRHRRTLYLREVHEVPFEEISSELGLTPEGARSIVFRARRVLRDRLVAVGEGFGLVVLGVKVRLRGLRVRSQLGNMAEATFSSALNLGLGLALVVGGSAMSIPAGSPSAGTSSPNPVGSLRADAIAPGGVAPQPSAASKASRSLSVPASDTSRQRPVTTDLDTGGKPSVDVGTNPPVGPLEELGLTVFFDDRRGPVSGPLMDQYERFCEENPATCEWAGRKL